MADKDQIIQALRATLISVKGALTLKECNRDYRELQGEAIPYKRLGYSTLDKLFQDVPGFKLKEINGEWYVDAIASRETQHIATMVSRQKSNKKPAKLNSPGRFPRAKQGSWRKSTSLSSYESNCNNMLYRAKTPYNNNNNSYNGKFNKYSKSFETKTNTHHSSKQPLMRNKSENYDKSAVNAKSNIQIKPEITYSAEIKHSTKNEKETDFRSSSKTPASERLTNFMDRLNTVDLIPLQLPAHKEQCDTTNFVNYFSFQVANDTVTHAVACSLEPPPDSTSAIVRLEWICKELGLPQPVFKVQDLSLKEGPNYACKVQVGSYLESSYPEPSSSEDLSKELASEKMLHAIQSSDAGRLPTSSNNKALLGLTEVVFEHEAGVWASHIPHLYREKYKENLPKNWLELVEKCPKIIMEKVLNRRVLIFRNSEISSSVTDYMDNDLPPLQFPKEDFWNVFITVANSSIEIWLRIIGSEYSDQFETLLADMAKYYDFNGTTIEKSMVFINAWYAVNLEDGGWQRAKIMEIHDDTATVFLGDHGDDDVVYLNQIKVLEPQFRRLPAQAILCRLDGAEELSASTTGDELVVQRLPGEVLVAAPGPRTDPNDPAVAVVLFDTSTQLDLNLNKEIVHDFCIAGGFTLTKELCEVEVGCVTDDGRVWVSRVGGAAVVRNALALLTSGPYRRPLPAAPQAPPTQPGTLYIVRTFAGDWVRCTIISGLDGEGTVRTQLVDSGLVMRAPLSSLVPLQSFSPALNVYPYQARQVRLGGAEQAASAMVERVRELLIDQPVLCRVAPDNTNATPTNVELFVRTTPQQLLVSVNHSISTEYVHRSSGKLVAGEKEKEATNHVEELSKKKERIFGPKSVVLTEDKSRPLPPPALPPVGQCFDVQIAMAANPWNFVVQPNSSRHSLQTMMADLQKECPKIPEDEIPTNPTSGELYTGYYEKDSSWYRVIIASSVLSDRVSVYFCDYGDLAMCPIRALRPVPATVPLARTLPPQAIKARLYDVWPLHQDWSVEDCIRFQELCVEQQFVGICKEVSKDPLNSSEPLLTLDLIDTSTDEDIYLNKQLVAEERARLGSASISDI
ncbi:tudor domain-containing protein 7B isoform X1 [Pieris brassicae]|uniref:tudor domain-containing protein 7B isoform X1 n=1 Tax=Pieris brassicae TaxID=7116 RepID=UPI001E65E788|nr:tudor domain-containing protein 7B isoform X1 [Pieris brassicae]